MTSSESLGVTTPPRPVKYLKPPGSALRSLSVGGAPAASRAWPAATRASRSAFHDGIARAVKAAALSTTEAAATTRKRRAAPASVRSEEHTSELQSRQYLVC